MRVDLRGAREAELKLAKFSESVEDWRPFWRELGRDLADESQRRWPLRRRSGRLRRSLTWRGTTLDKGGVFGAARDRLAFGTRVFYARFFQHGTTTQRARPLIHIEPERHTAQLDGWLRQRAEAAGLEVTT